MTTTTTLAQVTAPATPLPWRRATESRGTHRILSGDKLVGEASHYNEGAYANAAYIVEACNAYPRLLDENAALRAALRGLLEYADDVEAYEVERTGEIDAMPDPRIDAARALLGEG